MSPFLLLCFDHRENRYPMLGNQAVAMAYSTVSIREFWQLMRVARQKPFLVRRLLQRLERGEIDEREAAEWLACDNRRQPRERAEFR